MRRSLGISICLLGLLQAQQAPYPTMGAPADPKVEVHWNRYHDHARMSELLAEMAAAFPDLCRLESLGPSYGGREMWVLSISNFAQGDVTRKSGFWIDGGIHANELQGPEVVLYTAWYLLEMYGRNEFITGLLDERIFYLLPQLSPDSRDAHMYEPNTTHSPRTGQRPIDDDRDGRIDEDPADDLDGDGHITQMRVADPHGRMKPHPEFPELMVRCEPGEQGSYRMLGQEGIDNDEDGRVNEDGDGSYDPNRDWAWQWQPGNVQGGAYRYPFSIAENRKVADFVMAHPNIAGAQSYHNSGGMILRGPGVKEDRYERSDLRVYDAIGKKGAMMLPGYRYLNVAEDLYEVFGGELDWFYAMQGIITYTNELFTPFNFFRKESEGGYFGGQEDARRFDRYLLLGDGVVPWHEVDHPTYGKVEVGGMKKTWLRQPPSFLLEEECHRNMAFTLYHADQMPMVRIVSAELKELGDGLRQLTVVLENSRVIPTRLAVDTKNGISPPDTVSLLGEVETHLAMWSHEPFFTEPRLQSDEPARLRLPTVPGQGVRYVRFLFSGEEPVRVQFSSTKAGVLEKAPGE